MFVSNIILTIFSLLFLGCKGASFKEEQESAIFDAITSGSVENLEVALAEYQGNFDQIRFEVDDGNSETHISPLDLTIAAGNADMMSLVLDTKSPAITADTFGMVFKSSCFECFDVLLDHLKDRLIWSFKQAILEQMIVQSQVNSDYLIFVGKFCKHESVSFNDKLALIEKVFEKCTQNALSDYEKISLTIDSVIVSIAKLENDNGTSLVDERVAVFKFARAMLYKMDFDEKVEISVQNNQSSDDVVKEDFFKKFDEFLLWIDSQLDAYLKTGSESEKTKAIIDSFEKNRHEDYPQPEEYLIRYSENFFNRLNKALDERRFNSADRFILKILNKNNTKIWESLENREKVAKELNEALLLAIRVNMPQHVKLMLEAGANPDSIDSEHIPALAIAVYYPSYECAQLLLDYGADVKLAIQRENNLLLHAVQNCLDNVIVILLENGADINAVGLLNYTPLFVAVGNRSYHVVKLLLKKGAIINNPRRTKQPLVYAVSGGDTAMVLLLLKYGADTNVIDDEGNTPLSCAIKTKSIEIARILLDNYADPNGLFCLYERPLAYAVNDSQIEMVNLLLDKGALINLSEEYHAATPLMCAVQIRNIDMVKLLLNRGANPNSTCNKLNIRPLNYAVETDSIVIAKLLLDKKADPDYIFADFPPLITAVQKSNIDMVKLLLENNARRDAKDPFGMTALDYAIRQGAHDIVRILQG